MARGSRRPEQAALAHSDAAARVMDASAKGAGLSWPLVPWERTGSLSQRLSESPLLMAPMAGVTDAAWRLMARAGGAALAYSEMVSVTGMHYASEKTWELVDPNPAEPELAVQLFGREPDHFREAVAGVRERLSERLALIDINMACPVPKVVRNGAGSALLDEAGVAADIVRACLSEAGDVPVTCKIRIGRRPGAIVGADFARSMEEAGVSAVAVHGRTATQMYSGVADRGAIAEVVRAVSVPVIASGDALDAPRAAALLRDTGAAGVFVARGSYGNPWVFSQARELLSDVGSLGADGAPCASAAVADVSLDWRLAAFRLHVDLLEATGAHLARARSLAAWYLKAVPDAATWRERAMHCDNADEYRALIDAARLACEDAGLL